MYYYLPDYNAPLITMNVGGWDASSAKGQQFPRIVAFPFLLPSFGAAFFPPSLQRMRRFDILRRRRELLQFNDNEVN